MGIEFISGYWEQYKNNRLWRGQEKGKMRRGDRERRERRKRRKKGKGKKGESSYLSRRRIGRESRDGEKAGDPLT